jgi:hypothetical protein
VPDCGLKVFDGNGQLARDLRVQLPDSVDRSALALVHRQCIGGLTCSYALLEDGPSLLAAFLHPQLLPPGAVLTGPRRRTPGRWFTHALELGDEAGGRGVWGPDVFFRQVDLDAERAWLAPLLLRLGQRLPSRRIALQGSALWLFEAENQRYFYREHSRRAALYGAGNTPLLRLEQAVHLAQPETIDDYLWAVGAVPVA